MPEHSPASIEIGWREPFDVAKRLADVPGFAFLDSAMFHQKLGRYSYIGIAPFGVFTVSEGKPAWNGTPAAGAPLDVLRAQLRRYALTSDPALPPFPGRRHRCHSL